MRIHIIALTLLALITPMIFGTYKTEAHSYQVNAIKAREWDRMQEAFEIVKQSPAMKLPVRGK